jgi:hypothetical protein
MIKLFLISILVISCNSKVKYENLSEVEDKTSLNKFELLEFNPQIEMMLMFLWPKDLGPENEKEVVGIISRSRTISENKEKYLADMFLLNSQYSQKNCDCHSYGICEDDDVMNDDISLECDEISFKQKSNDLILANLTLDHEFIKEKLLLIGATNIEVGADEDFLDIGSFNLATNVLKIKQFRYLGQKKLLEFKILPSFGQNLKATFEFYIDDELFIGDLGISNKKHNVIFSGEITTNTGQRGLIYWEHLK